MFDFVDFLSMRYANQPIATDDSIMNLAFVYFPSDYRTDHPYVVGRHVGTESFFRASLRHARPDPVYCYASAPANPLRPDPFWLYQDVPTAALALNDRVGVVANPPALAG